ncbi:hypothetical protein PAPHI01_2427 [Pancytospora philotis]|nr:hypothetical protein PAPHI01_1972 [Pancytospora philotis]KAI4293153.1 hypothetical protein PAPHI01_2427 [Pancytospora philotis]
MSDGGLRNPFVVQCRSCRSILSDSFTLHTLKHGFLVHAHGTLQPAAGVYAGGGLFSKCQLQDLVCACGARTGHFIASGGGEWNGCAEMYAFDKNRITSYVLGTEAATEKSLYEVVDDVEKLKTVVAKLYKKVYQL